MRPEKLFVMNFQEFMPTLITRDKAGDRGVPGRAWRNRHEAALRAGGGGVFKVGRIDPNFGSLYDMFTTMFREPWVCQRPAAVTEATSASSWSTASRWGGQPGAGRQRYLPNMVRGGRRRRPS